MEQEGALVHVESVFKSFGKKRVLNGGSLKARRGQIMGLIGPSGCGKTTLVKLVVGSAVPSSGHVFLGGEEAPYPTMRKCLGYMPQDAALYEGITAHENLAFFGALQGLARAQVREREAELLPILGLEDTRDQLVGSFSGGMKRRLSLAVALVAKPDILLMDELTVGLDPVRRLELWGLFRLLADGGAALLVTTHVMDEAACCDIVALMREGTLVSTGPPQAILESTSAGSLEEAFVALVESEGKGDGHA
jgi:ABC-2 type transport system ATP-binding protein